MKVKNRLRKALFISLILAICLLCIICLSATVNIGKAQDSESEVTNVSLPYVLKSGNTGAVTSEDIVATKVEKTNSLGQTLKGVELSSSQEYKLNNDEWYPVNGYSMGYSQYLTFKIDDVIDMSKPVEFLFSPYVIGDLGAQANHRFVMAISDKDGEIKPLTNSSSNGFNSDGNYIYWEFAKHQQWASQVAPETQGNGPTWYAVSSAGTTATGYDESIDNIGTSEIKNNRLGSKSLARAFYGVEYLWGDVDPKYVDPSENSQQLIKARIEFTDTQLIIMFEHVSAGNIEDKGTSSICSVTHDFSSDSPDNCTTCYFKKTYNLADLNFTSDSELKLYFGYYNVHARFSGQNYGALPMSLKLYNYTNGTLQKFGVKAGKENNVITENQTLNIADIMDIVYYDGVKEHNVNVTYKSLNERLIKIEDGQIIPQKGTEGGEATIEAIAETGEKAYFTVTLDVNTVTYNGEVVGYGDSYTFTEDIYKGNAVLVGYKLNGKLYAVGDTVAFTEDVVIEEVTVDFRMIYGASIRLDRTASIRFTAIINTLELAEIESLAGVDKVSYGMTINPSGIDKVYTIDSKNEGFDTAVYGQDPAFTLYSAVMTEIPSDNYSTELTAQGYIKITYSDGDVATLNCKLADKKEGDIQESNVRSLSDVASEAYNDRSDIQNEKYPYEIASGEYSPYTVEQIEEFSKYIVGE